MLNSRNLSLDGTNPPKLKSLFVGPFKILKKVGPVAYTLDMPATFKGHPTFHVAVLKKFSTADSKFPLRAASSKPPQLYFHRGRQAAREFRVKWKGYQELTWEPVENLLQNQCFIEYLNKLPQRRGRR